MPQTTAERREQIKKLYRPCPLDCQQFLQIEIETLSDFLGVLSYALSPENMLWFRGHPCMTYRLAPSALRYEEIDERNTALGLLSEMRRFLEMKLARPPASDDHLAWMQVAQHYGLPTRLLDWTQNAAVALFFACSKGDDKDGLVVALNPTELNQQSVPNSGTRIFNWHTDKAIITPYLNLNGKLSKTGKKTIAINPTWNTERIAMQQGAFTLHGDRTFELNRQQASSMLYLPILKQNKQRLLQELHRVGIGEMFIFPEPEHVCSHLKRTANLR